MSLKLGSVKSGLSKLMIANSTKRGFIFGEKKDCSNNKAWRYAKLIYSTSFAFH